MSRVVERIGTPATVAALGMLVVLGLGIAFFVFLRQSTSRAQEADRSFDIAAISEAGIELLAEVQLERGLATLFLTTGDTAALARYEEHLAVTDAAVARYQTLWRRSDSVLRAGVAGGPGLPDLRLLNEVRLVFTGLDGEESATTELYGGLIDQVRQSISDLAFVATDATELRLRRASLSLLAAADAIARRRALVAAVLGADDPVPAESALQISLHSRDFAVNVDSAAASVAGANRARVLTLHGSAAAVAVAETIDSLLESGVSGAGLDPSEWFERASRQLEEVMAVASEINAVIVDHAADGVARSRRASFVTGAATGALLLVALLASWSAIAASRGRVRALEEHRELVDGLLAWFGAESMPVVDGVEIEARYVPAAPLSGAGGDWYDLFSDDSGNLGLVVGDVAGHGAPTVARMAEVRNMIRALAHAGVGGPARQLEIVDQTVDELHLTTVFYAVVDVAGGELTYSRAGHVPGVLRRGDGTFEILYHGSDTPIGVRQDAGRTEHMERFTSGDMLVLFTDGLIEGPMRDVLERIDRVAADVIAPFSGDLGDLAERLLAQRPVVEHVDDASVLIVRMTAASLVDVHGRQQAGDLQDPQHRH
jgi:hypothetical protein